MIWSALILIIALDNNEIKPGGFPLGIGNYMLGYMNLARDLGNFSESNNEAFFSDVKNIGSEFIRKVYN